MVGAHEYIGQLCCRSPIHHNSCIFEVVFEASTIGRSALLFASTCDNILYRHSYPDSLCRQGVHAQTSVGD